MYTWTADQALDANPCARYTRDKVSRLWAGRDALAPADIAALDIPPTDRVWALLRMAPRNVWLPAIFAAADRAVRVYAPASLRRVGQADQADRLAALPRLESIKGCHDAADAACDSANYADAAYYAACAATYAASDVAAYDATCAAHYAAFAAAAADAERAQQISDLVALIEAAGDGEQVY